jgi:hypothetical protein
MTDPKKLAEEAKRLAVEYAASAVYAANDHSLIGESVAASHKLNATIDQLSALAEKAERLEAALKAIVETDDAQELEQSDIERGRAALSTGEPK